tara:strand:+ start:75 stop:233 length:159 start_codon:yes stop_codon:yes gene_type:complete
MPDPKTCAAKGLKPGTKAYNDCISYKGAYANKGKANPVKARIPKPPAAGGGY